VLIYLFFLKEDRVGRNGDSTVTLMQFGKNVDEFPFSESLVVENR
jgi:hypothetical protein